MLIHLHTGSYVSSHVTMMLHVLEWLFACLKPALFLSYFGMLDFQSAGWLKESHVLRLGFFMALFQCIYSEAFHAPPFCIMVFCNYSDAGLVWRVLVGPIPHRGPYVITASLEDVEGYKIELKDVLFGDIWVCVEQNKIHLSVSKVSHSTVAF